MNLSGCAVNNRKFVFRNTKIFFVFSKKYSFKNIVFSLFFLKGDSKKEAFCFKITHPSAKAHRGARMNYDYVILKIFQNRFFILLIVLCLKNKIKS